MATQGGLSALAMEGCTRCCQILSNLNSSIALIHPNSRTSRLATSRKYANAKTRNRSAAVEK